MSIDIDAASCGNLGAFVGACSFIVALCRAMLVHIGNCAPSKRQSFVRLGPLAFLNKFQIPY